MFKGIRIIYKNLYFVLKLGGQYYGNLAANEHTSISKHTHISEN